MCTVTFVLSKSGYILTHNRDEMLSRTPSEVPEYHEHNSTWLLYPKDPEGNGTWIALNEKGNWACLLNGAFNHYGEIRNKQQSRGKIAIEVLINNRVRLIDQSLECYLPFTLLLYEDNRLWDIRWDGNKLHQQEKNTKENHIWSSTNMYPKDIREQREQWFSDFLKDNSADPEGLWKFHKHGGVGANPQHRLHMSVPGKQATVSTTQIFQENNDIQFIHTNFVNRNHLKIRPNFVNE